MASGQLGYFEIVNSNILIPFTSASNYDMVIRTDNNTQKMFIGNGINQMAGMVVSSNLVGIGTVTPSYPLHVVGTSNNISISVSGDIASSSDIRKKKDLTEISNALAKVKALTGYTFMRDGDTRRSAGLVAQEVAYVLPEVVSIDEQDFLNISYGNIVGLLVNAIKELDERINALAASL